MGPEAPLEDRAGLHPASLLLDEGTDVGRGKAVHAFSDLLLLAGVRRDESLLTCAF